MPKTPNETKENTQAANRKPPPPVRYCPWINGNCLQGNCEMWVHISQNCAVGMIGFNLGILADIMPQKSHIYRYSPENIENGTAVFWHTRNQPAEWHTGFIRGRYVNANGDVNLLNIQKEDSGKTQWFDTGEIELVIDESQ